MFPHWTGWKTVKLCLFLVSAAVSGVASASLPPDAPASFAAYVHYVMVALGLLGSVVTMLSGSSMANAPAPAKLELMKPRERGFVSMRALFGLTLTALVAVCLAHAIVGCTPVQQVEAGVATVDTAVCILNTATQDKAAGMSDAATVLDVVAKCGADAESIARILDAQAKAEIVAPGKVAGVAAAAKAMKK